MIIRFVIYILLHFAACMVFFLAILKPVFIAYNRKVNPEHLTGRDVFDIYRYGYKTDMIASAYLTAPAMLVAWVHAFAPSLDVTVPLIVYECVMAVVVSLVSLADTALYRFWRTKIDSSVLLYLRNLKGAFASVTPGYIVTAFLCVALLACVYSLLLISVIGLSGIYICVDASHDWLYYVLAAVAGILCLGGLFLAVRGLNIRPNTPSIAYYCRNMFYNHSAINSFYNFVYSFSIEDDYDNKYRFFDQSEVDETVKRIFPTSGTPTRRILNTTRPNILLVVWESLCADYVGACGGRKGVTVNLDRYAEEGVIFTNVRAGSFRTDRGIVCVLSGIPGQPSTSLVRHTRKLPAVPALPRTLKGLGYSTTVMHGGDMSLLHKSDYYAAAGNDRMIAWDDLDKKAPTCRWGIHDDWMMDYVYRDIVSGNNRRPWMITLQTLSSHEPFIVPFNKLEHKISNAYAFTDDAFGRMVEKLRATDQWKDLLIIVVGDHGMNDNDVPMTHHDYSHIPILMLGGAVNGHAVIDTPMAQTDLVATLLGQMDIDHSQYLYSRDVLADTYTDPSALHVYVDGFVYSDATGHTDFNLVSDSAIESPDPTRERKGKSIIQHIYTYLSSL